MTGNFSDAREELERGFISLKPVCEGCGIDTDKAIAIASKLSKHTRYSFMAWTTSVKNFVSRTGKLPEIEEKENFDFAVENGMFIESAKEFMKYMFSDR